jgi:hypothetical protein
MTSLVCPPLLFFLLLLLLLVVARGRFFEIFHVAIGK